MTIRIAFLLSSYDGPIVRGGARGPLSGRCQWTDSAAWYVRDLASTLDFLVLGPLEVHDGERLLTIGGARQRSVLAILLLHRGETVSSDRLIDELWGERPPADAQTALQQHVSRLRRALEPHAVLVTRAPGYAIEIASKQLDLERFRRLVDQGRGELDGAPEAAAQTLRRALELWRGQPLADLASEPFAADAARALDEERLAALEARIDADLARGQHAQLVGELTALVRASPLRERLRTQLMLALYRAGRQSDALDAYSDARQTLVSELGLDPGPELQELQQAILTQDESLRAPQPVARRRRRRLIALLATAVASALLAAAIAALVLRDGDAAGSSAAVGDGTLVAVDPESGEIERRIPVGRTPSAVAVGGGAIWLLDADARTVLRVLPSSRVIETIATGATPTDVAFGVGSLWVANGRRLEGTQFIGPVATAVARFDATTRTERAAVRLPRVPGAVSNLVDNHLAVSADALWAIAPDFSVVRIDATTGARTATTRALPAAAIAAGRAGVWVLGVDGSVVRLHERTGRPTLRTRVPASSVGSIAVGPDAVWVTSPADGMLWRIGGGRTATLGATELDRGVSDVVVGEDEIWVANPLAGVLLRIDTRSAQLEHTIDLGAIPRSVAYDDQTVWVAADSEPTAATTEVAGIRPHPGSTCEPVVAGKGGADLLLVSDLPLQGGVRVSTTQMTQAIAFVLREHEFRAGRFKVAYQSCDDSVASTGLFDEPKCAANARAYAENPDVVGVIGTFNSPCALAALPELNRASDGPLAMVSPSNSFVGLTRAGPDVDPVLPAALYPTGVRNFARVHPTDDLEGAALALFARDRGRSRVFVLDDGQPGYGALQATAFETAARRLGLTVLGRESWDPRARTYADIAARVAASGATAVYLGGLVDTNAGAVVRALRARLGQQVDLLGPSGLTPVPLLVKSSDEAALGMYLSLTGVVPEGLSPAGARWARRFGATQRGVPVEPSAVYVAQATEVLLDAIARSDGTRASVVHELFETRVTDGLLGSFRFDANGDISESPVTIVRVERPSSGNKILSVAGAKVASVERPSPALVAPDE
jgi:DNA-binding SARP family transcriptional activator/ABC-type branched-subunit amino acid transport system substrate-binding protein